MSFIISLHVEEELTSQLIFKLQCNVNGILFSTINNAHRSVES